MSGPMNKRRVDPVRIFCYVFLFVFGVVLLYPVWYAVFGAMTTQSELDAGTGLFPPVHIENIANYFTIFLANGLLQSILITLLRFVWHFLAETFIAVLLGFIFARMNFWGKRGFFLMLMMSMMIPGIAMTVPNYIYLGRLTFFGPNGLIDNPLILFVTGLVNVYNIFLCRQIISSMGSELQEAAEIDGAGFLRTVFGIYLPLIQPVIAVIFINMFAGHWSDYTTSLVFLRNNTEWQTIGYKVTELMDYYVGSTVRETPKMYAIAIVTMIPPVIAFLCVQDRFIEGLALGGVKG